MLHRRQFLSASSLKLVLSLTPDVPYALPSKSKDTRYLCQSLETQGLLGNPLPSIPPRSQVGTKLGAEPVVREMPQPLLSLFE